ncbi:signal transduction histidine kinase [Hymenobacter luteus]|uniref:histidine kinase n=2 Tax=Hymenobacter TaxID=89966 RepID=A0A7W9T095_9BACT|nr:MULTISPECIES: ATP-binding protein [Hymenobacter]MBB4600586.1 signal transduction histidine kinase [Hymenobacter latericoloratus]MBB6059207.1 signal transduction histidine kinase [Hymenobacter luteus]
MDLNADVLLSVVLALFVVRGLRRFLDLPTRLPRLNQLLGWLWLPGLVLFIGARAIHWKSDQLDELYMLLVMLAVTTVLFLLRSYRPARTLLLGLGPFLVLSAVELLLSGTRLLQEYDEGFDTAKGFSFIWMFTSFFIARSQKKHLEKERIEREEEEKARRLMAAQKVELERLVAERTAILTQQAEELREALTELKTTQAQLIQAEKMASLGELTAGIAHEIQNPLNFVTNFSDVSAELVTELEEEQQNPDRDPALEAELLGDLKQNLLKINHHGQRAASIVRGMLEHSRASTGERQSTDLNTLADEYLRLAYHGLRAKDKTFNATLVTHLEPGLPPIEVVSQDVGRVLLNLFTNAFYAVQKRKELGQPGYTPTVTVTTRQLPDGDVEVRVHDNGTGIPPAVVEKIFQPFFTTKPTGEGTGLGLSLSYDIITKGHGGTLVVETQEGHGTEFIVTLPH